MSASRLKIIESAISDYAPLLGANAAGFLTRVYKNGIDVYRRRVDRLGFGGMARVLDAGCGFGQWSLALAEANHSVDAVDVAAERLLFLRDLSSRLEMRGIRPLRAGLDATGFPDGHFDAVFCYGVLFLTPWRETLCELARVLKPGGRLYATANGFGWYRHLWRSAHNAAADYDPAMLTPRALRNTLNYRRGLPIESGVDILIEPEELTAELERLGFGRTSVGPEASVAADGSVGEPIDAFFPGTYDGDLGVYECLAVKNG